MKKTDKGNFAFSFMRSLARVIDNPDAMLNLYYKGINIAVVQPQTNEYWDRKDILRQYRWEDFPDAYGEDVCCMWVNRDVAIMFDEFREYYI